MSQGTTFDRREDIAAPADGGYFSYHGLWSPGVRAFRRMRFTSKAGCISLAFLVPLCLLGVIFVQDRLETIRGAAAERDGVAYARQVVALMNKAKDFSALSLREASKLPAGGLADARQALEAQLAKVDEADKLLGAALGTSELLAKVHDALKAVAPPSEGLMKVYATSGRLSEATYRLIVAAADGSGLTLDPDLDTFYLMDAGIMNMPRAADELARMQSLAAAAAAMGQGGEVAAVELNRLDVIIEELERRASDDLTKVLGVHPEEAALLETTATNKLIDALRDQATDAPGAGGAGKADKVNATGGSVASALSGVQSRTIDLLDQQLGARQARSWRAMVWVGAAILACLLGAAYLFYCFFVVMNGGLNEVRRHLDLMKDGDLTSSPRPWGSDDAADLMLSLAATQQAMRDIVAQVRAASEQIASSSGQIAEGAGDMSARTEQAAAHLQRSSSSMTEISGTVSHTADVAGEAATLANENASVAGEGGVIMGNVVATMDEINASSKKISDIIGVIDGIAFQTNILALNAAVEAARAGEQGRGFAVVAAEVRNLAQRSSSAAREIKTLIGASVEKVETGTSVVRRAGDTMTRIVDCAERIRSALDDISSSAQLQRQGLVEIGSTVKRLDDSTQQNAALSEQTAAAAGSLRGQAADLLDRVARFKLNAQV